MGDAPGNQHDDLFDSSHMIADIETPPPASAEMTVRRLLVLFVLVLGLVLLGLCLLAGACVLGWMALFEQSAIRTVSLVLALL